MKLLTNSIGEISLEIKTGKTPTTQNENYFNGGVYWYTPGDLNGTTYLKESKRTITDLAIKDKAATIFEKNTVLISCIGDIGKTGITTRKSSSNQQITGIRLRSNIDPLFFLYWCRHHKNIFENNARNAVVPILNNAVLSKIKITYPEQLEDQIRIATLLSRVEALIATRKNNLRLLDEFLKATFLEMFGDPAINEKKWDINSLENLCRSPKDIKCGPFGTQLSKSEYQSDGVAVWGIPQINSGFSVPPNDYVSPEKAIELNEYSVKWNDIVMSRKGAVGKCSLYPSNLPSGIMHSDVLRIRADWQKTNPIYLCWQLRLSRDIERQIANVSSGAIMAGINVGKLKSISVLTPPIELQNQFAKIVEKAESLQNHYQQNLTELENLYAALSQQAFKGELDLSRVPLPEQVIHHEGHEDHEENNSQNLSDLRGEPSQPPVSPSNLIQLFENFISQQSGDFSLASFWQIAEQSLLESTDEDLKPWSVEDYDQVKQRLFELVKNGNIRQHFNETSNQIELSSAGGG